MHTLCTRMIESIGRCLVCWIYKRECMQVYVCLSVCLSSQLLFFGMILTLAINITFRTFLLLQYLLCLASYSISSPIDRLQRDVSEILRNLEPFPLVLFPTVSDQRYFGSVAQIISASTYYTVHVFSNGVQLASCLAVQLPACLPTNISIACYHNYYYY